MFSLFQELYTQLCIFNGFSYLQMNPYVTELSLYDIAGTPGVAADISHVNTPAVTKVNILPQLQPREPLSQKKASCRFKR